MQSRSNALKSKQTLPIISDGWSISLGFHALLIGAIIFVIHWKPETSENIPIEIFDAPKVAKSPIQSAAQNPPKKVAAPPKRAVFGVSKDSHLATTPSAPEDVEIKAGNTITKTPDALQLNPDDETQLPMPTAEYLVSSMPVVEEEIRVPFTPEARKAGIQGVVILDLLIDAAGKVRQVTFIEGPGYGLNEAAIDALKKFKFRPAYVESRAVAVRIRYAYRFVLEQ